MHLRPPDRPRPRQAAPQPARGVVPQHQLRSQRQRPRGHDLPQPAATVASLAARIGLLADLPLPRPDRPDADAAGRHRAVQVRLVRAVRARQAGAQHGLLEAGTALSRRHRVHHRHQLTDGAAELPRRPLRHHFPLGGDDPAAPRSATAFVEGGMRDHVDEQQHQPAGQSRRRALRQSGHPPGAHSGARPQGLHCRPQRRRGRDRRQPPAAG